MAKCDIAIFPNTFSLEVDISNTQEVVLKNQFTMLQCIPTRDEWYVWQNYISDCCSMGVGADKSAKAASGT